jgi:hypothetical protein
MKKNLSGKIAVLLLIFASVSGVMFGATLTISGTIAPEVWLSFDGTEGGSQTETYTTLDLTSAGTNVTVGTATYFSNTLLYTFTISSENAGQLKRADDAINVVPYTVSFGDLTGAELTTTAQDVLTAPNITAAAGDALPITVSYSAVANNFPADTYSDVMTIVISAP